jgi:hypothetical protein
MVAIMAPQPTAWGGLTLLGQVLLRKIHKMHFSPTTMIQSKNKWYPQKVLKSFLMNGHVSRF